MILQVVTVGISLLRNFVFSKYREDIINKYGMNSWIKLRPEDGEQENVMSQAYSGSDVFNALLEYVINDPYSASAELNSFHNFERINGLKKEEQEIALYSTDTGNGWLCSMVLYEYLRKRGYRLLSEPIKVNKFGWGPDFIDDALSDLMDKLVRLIVNKKNAGYRIYINATGGLKPESAFLIISALLSGADSIYYMHQFYGDVAILPIIPLSIRQEYLRYLEYFREGLPVEYYKDFLSIPKEVLIDFEQRKLIEIKDGRIKLKKWVNVLLDIVKNSKMI